MCGLNLMRRSSKTEEKNIVMCGNVYIRDQAASKQILYWRYHRIVDFLLDYIHFMFFETG